jgi:hypothetical protein
MKFIKLFENFDSSDKDNLWTEDFFEELDELFLELEDYDYSIDVETDIYIDVTNGVVPDFDNTGKYQLLRSGIQYNIGFSIEISTGRGESDEDLTYEFLTIISQLRGSGWSLVKITKQFSNIHIPKEEIKIYDGIIMASGKTTNPLILYFSGLKTIKFTDMELVKHYKMTDWVERDGEVYVEMGKQDLASLFIPEKSDYYSYLVDGEELDYFSDGYYPSPKDLADQYSDVSLQNKEKLIRIIINELGGLDEFTQMFSEYLPNGEFNIEEIAKNGRGVDLGMIFKKSFQELKKFKLLIDEISSTISSWRSGAHESRNKEEIDWAFESLLDKHISYSTSMKEVKMNKYKDGKVERSWMEEKEFYIIKFDSDWLQDSKIDLEEGSVSEIFSEWALGFDKPDINPRLSDWGDVDEGELNIELGYIIDNFS